MAKKANLKRKKVPNVNLLERYRRGIFRFFTYA